MCPDPALTHEKGASRRPCSFPVRIPVQSPCASCSPAVAFVSSGLPLRVVGLEIAQVLGRIGVMPSRADRGGRCGFVSNVGRGRRRSPTHRVPLSCRVQPKLTVPLKWSRKFTGCTSVTRFPAPSSFAYAPLPDTIFQLPDACVPATCARISTTNVPERFEQLNVFRTCTVQWFAALGSVKILSRVVPRRQRPAPDAVNVPAPPDLGVLTSTLTARGWAVAGVALANAAATTDVMSMIVRMVSPSFVLLQRGSEDCVPQLTQWTPWPFGTEVSAPPPALIEYSQVSISEPAWSIKRIRLPSGENDQEP